MFTSSQVVPAGPYFGFTLPQLETELSSLITARQSINQTLAGASVAGQSFQFADIEKQRVELDRRQQDLAAAFNYLDPGRFPLPPSTNSAVCAL